MAEESGATNGEAAIQDDVEKENGDEGEDGSHGSEDNIEELYDMDHYDSEDEGEGKFMVWQYPQQADLFQRVF